MKNYIKGTYKQTIYQSDKSYTIGLFKVKETDIETMQEYCNKLVTFTGYFHELNENENYYFFGEESTHPKYGFQFNVKSYERVKPEDKDGIVEFLSSDLFKGVGEKLAASIVEYLGDGTLETILKDKDSLLIVPKMTTKKADIIYETLVKYEESHMMIVQLTELGFNMKDSLSIYNTYKANTMMILENNIYRIIDDLEDIAFPKIDAIVRKRELNIDPHLRSKAGAFYCLKELTFKNGDTYFSIDEISDMLYRQLGFDVDINQLDQLLLELSSEMKIHIEGDKYYLEEIYEAQYNITNKVTYLLNKEKNKHRNLDKKIAELGERNSIVYNSDQIAAIKKALENNIVIITGGPGTGKTTIIRAIVELYKDINKCSDTELMKSIALLAPTGRASKRMSESTDLPASTIHRFLKWNKDINKFAVNEYNPDFSKLIIVDEVSMIDIPLMDNLFKGLTNGIQLVLVGDYNQLPSVGPGMILKDFIDSKIIDVVELNFLYRQKEDSYIPELAKEIKENNLGDFLATKDDYTFLKCSSNGIVPSLEKLCMHIMEKDYDYRKVQLMAPMYAGVNGIDNLNKVLQDIFNPKSPEKNEYKYGDIIFREGDKILQLVNMPDDNVFNGDIGIITSIRNNPKNEVTVDYDGTLVTYVPKDLINIKHGFMISIHKSQGSEFDIVVIPISRNYQRMLYRKLIYTGITRAKKKLILIGEPETFEYCVSNEQEQPRKSDLLDYLIGSIKTNL